MSLSCTATQCPLVAQREIHECCRTPRLSAIADFSYLPKSVRVNIFGVTFSGIPSIVILHYEKISLFPSAIFQGVFIKHLSQALLSKTESRKSLPHRIGVGRYYDNWSISQLYISGLKKIVYHYQSVLMASFWLKHPLFYWKLENY